MDALLTRNSLYFPVKANSEATVLSRTHIQSSSFAVAGLSVMASILTRHESGKYGGICTSALPLSFVFFHGSCSFFVLLELPPPPPTRLVSRTCLSASVLTENAQRFTVLLSLLLLLLLKEKVQADRQFFFKEVNFKKCLSDRKKTDARLKDRKAIYCHKYENIEKTENAVLQCPMKEIVNSNH